MKLLKPFLFTLILALTLAGNTAIDYNSDISRRMRTYSLIAHCSQDQIINWHCKLCTPTEQLKDIQYMENKQSQIMVYAGFMTSIDKIIFVFRGTIDAVNWLQDFSFYQVPYKRCSNCKVHQGFYVSYLSVVEQVVTAVKKLRQIYPDKEIVFTGASLGGALATIAAIEVHSQVQKISELHTYGSPRVGNMDFSMFVKTRIPKSLRVVHNRDIVPHVPLLNQNYHHIPSQILYDEQMFTYKICSEGGEDPDCSNAYYPNYSAQDHVTYWIKLNVADICAQSS